MNIRHHQIPESQENLPSTGQVSGASAAAAASISAALNAQQYQPQNVPYTGSNIAMSTPGTTGGTITINNPYTTTYPYNQYPYVIQTPQTVEHSWFGEEQESLNQKASRKLQDYERYKENQAAKVAMNQKLASYPQDELRLNCVNGKVVNYQEYILSYINEDSDNFASVYYLIDHFWEGLTVIEEKDPEVLEELKRKMDFIYGRN